MSHLFVAISYHGFGHIAQTSAVLNEFVRRHPSVEITIQSSAPLSVLQRRMPWDFAYEPAQTDIGMLMQDAVTVRLDASYNAHRQFHAQWQTKLDEVCAVLKRTKPDLILANVPYLVLAAAQQLRIPAIALCSLNWADLFSHYCKKLYEISIIHEAMLDAYNSARYFIQPTPSMPMPHLTNTIQVDPIFNPGVSRRRELIKWLNLPHEKKIILLSPGGFDIPIGLDQWPIYDDVHFLVPEHLALNHPCITPLPTVVEMPYTDIMCSCDALIAKPGYGTFSESVGNGIPILFLRRPDWPEEPYLVDWLLKQKNGIEISRHDLFFGKFTNELEKIWSIKREPKPALGQHQVVQILSDFLVS